MYRYAALDTKTARAFTPLTYERYRRALTDETALPGVIAVGAYQLWQPIGLLLGVYDADTRQARLLSITVASEHQTRGIGTELLRQFEEHLTAQGCQSITVTYVGDNPALERAFAKQGWETPRIMGIAIESNVSPMQSSPIYQIRPTVPPDFEVFDWRDLTHQEREAIQTRETQPGGWYSATGLEGSVSPFVEEQFIDGYCSVGLRHQGTVVGWMIVQRVREETLHFSALFISPEYRSQQLGIMLVMIAARRVVDYYQVHAPMIRVFWQFVIENKVMEQMVEQYLTPYAISVSREKVVLKKLS